MAKPEGTWLLQKPADRNLLNHVLQSVNQIVNTIQYSRITE